MQCRAAIVHCFFRQATGQPFFLSFFTYLLPLQPLNNMNKPKPVYLDYAATTPVDRRVAEVMIPWLTENFGNAASRTHAYGWDAEKAVKQAREQVGRLISAKPEDVIFTSGATEAINLALKGLYEANRDWRNHIITVDTEHKAVLDTCQYLEKTGAKVTYLPVQPNGLIWLADLEAALTDQTLVVAVMHANNETGVIQPIREIARLAHRHGAYFMTDATQTVGKIPVDVVADEIDLMAFSGHKLYGPKGIGALYVKGQYPKIKLAPLLHGGGHERGLRSGTLNVPAIVGFGKACELCQAEMETEGVRLRQLRDELEAGLQTIEGVSVNGAGAPRLPNISNVCFEGIEAEALIMAIRDELAVSSGSACTSAEMYPSHVLMAMFDDEDVAYSSVRISVGRFINIDMESLGFIIKNKTQALKFLAI